MSHSLTTKGVTTSTPPPATFVRTLRKGSQGPDVVAVKRALVKWDHGKSAGTNLADTFGSAAVALLKQFQHGSGLVQDGVYGPESHAKLKPYFDLYGRSLLEQERQILAPRKQIVEVYRWMIAHRDIFDYAQVRPIPLGLPKYETSHRIETDCSGSITLAAKWAGATDPNGNGFNGAGNTGDMLHHCENITAGEAKPGDLIWYGAGSWDGYGHHVVLILEKDGVDFVVGSHGHQGCPEQILHSQEAAGQRAEGYPYVRFLSWLPN